MKLTPDSSQLNMDLNTCTDILGIWWYIKLVYPVIYGRRFWKFWPLAIVKYHLKFWVGYGQVMILNATE